MDVSRRYHCACGYGTDVKRCFIEHRRTHTDERPYACECGAKFRRSNHLASHQKRKIVTIGPDNEKTYSCRPVKKRAKPTSTDGGTARPWKCECGSTFKWHHLLISHQRGYSCPAKTIPIGNTPGAANVVTVASPVCSNLHPLPRAQLKIENTLGGILHKEKKDIKLPRISSLVSPPSPPAMEDHHHSRVHFPRPNSYMVPQQAYPQMPPSVLRPITPPDVYHMPHPQQPLPPHHQFQHHLQQAPQQLPWIAASPAPPRWGYGVQQWM